MLWKDTHANHQVDFPRVRHWAALFVALFAVVVIVLLVHGMAWWLS